MGKSVQMPRDPAGLKSSVTLAQVFTSSEDEYPRAFVNIMDNTAEYGKKADKNWSFFNRIQLRQAIPGYTRSEDRPELAYEVELDSSLTMRVGGRPYPIADPQHLLNFYIALLVGKEGVPKDHIILLNRENTTDIMKYKNQHPFVILPRMDDYDPVAAARFPLENLLAMYAGKDACRRLVWNGKTDTTITSKFDS